MNQFRDLIHKLDQAGELLTVNRSVSAQFELGALLKRAEARRKAILFTAVTNSDFPVVASMLTTAQRMAQGLGLDNEPKFTRAQHADLIRAAIQSPIGVTEVSDAPCKEVCVGAADVDCASLPVPTFFADDSGPFLTAAVGISRNPDNGVLNVGMYRILMLGGNQVAVSASPSSDLFRFLANAQEQGATTSIALAIGASPAVLMAAAAKVPADRSELDVAGALNGVPLEVIAAETSDLLVPADAEFVIELEVDSTTTVMNKMGEFGDYYGEQLARVATVTAITHRKDAVFHALMAGAGSEHNSIGFIILYELERTLKALLSESYPSVSDVRVHFDPPRMGVMGDIYLQLALSADIDTKQLISDVFAMRCNELDIARVIRRIVVVDSDIEISEQSEIDWAVSVRANTSEQIFLWENFPASGSKVRIGINATANADEKESLKRLVIPGFDSIRLDDYLD